MIMKTILYLSPHFDDVVFSCPGHLISQRRKGYRTVVATVFSEGDHEERKREDLSALEICKAEHRWLGYLDAPFRNPTYNSFSRIVFGEIDGISLDLSGLIDEVGPDILVAPLGVGTHVDHRLVFEATKNLQFKNTLFYEDRPYSLIQGATELRLQELGYDIDLPDFKDFWRDFKKARYVQRFLDKNEQEAVKQTLRDKWSAQGNDKGVAIIDSPSFHDGAIHCYQSQLNDFVNPEQLPKVERLFKIQ